jgi:hypothetical protein
VRDTQKALSAVPLVGPAAFQTGASSYQSGQLCRIVPRRNLVLTPEPMIVCGQHKERYQQLTHH